MISDHHSKQETKENKMSLLLFLLAILGLLSLTKLALSTLYYAYAFFLRPAKPLKTRYGPWAVVTGSTDGIGKGIAFELARNSLNLVLVGRSPAKLHSVSASIKRKHPETEIKTVVFDLAGDLRAGLQTLNEAIGDVDVGVLVNNAGVAHQNSFYFHEDEMELYMEMVKVNLAALTEITRAVLRGMLERKRGAVVNIGSGGAAVIPSYPLFSVYAATKAYVQQFSRSLYVEYKDKGIDVQCQAPSYVDTKMVPETVRANMMSLFKPSPDTFARSVVRWIGYEPLSVPYFPHFLQWCAASRAPDSLNYHLRMKENLSQMKTT